MSLGYIRSIRLASSAWIDVALSRQTCSGVSPTLPLSSSFQHTTLPAPQWHGTFNEKQRKTLDDIKEVSEWGKIIDCNIFETARNKKIKVQRYSARRIQINGYYAIQSHSRSPISVPIESPYATSSFAPLPSYSGILVKQSLLTWSAFL